MNRLRRSAGFTLVELMVVVAIIVVLMALLTPGLAAAKKVAKTTICAANVRSIAQVMNVYGAEWDGAILGNGNTTARFMYNSQFTAATTGDLNCPNVIQNYDWMSPVAKTMGRGFDELGAPADRAKRFQQMMAEKMFKCPAADLSGLFYPTGTGGLGLSGVQPLPNYCTALLFHWNGYNGGVVFQTYTNSSEVMYPSSYRPRIQMVGEPSTKLFIADGARYSDAKNKPDLNLSAVASDEATQFADAGACFQNNTSAGEQTHCWDRSLAPGNANANGGSPAVDARIYAYRHGTTAQKSPSGAYKMNAGFFDGHAELISDKDSANPAMWMPSGCSVPKISGTGDALLQVDSQKYVSGSTYTAP